MKPDKKEIGKLKDLISSPPLNIVLVAHHNPDGDAIGSVLALAEWLRGKGHRVTSVVPNQHPAFLAWMPGIGDLMIYRNDSDGVVAARAAEADVVLCVDFNQLSRLEGLGDVILANKKAKFVLVDHHLDPPKSFDISFSHTDSSSTAFIVYSLIGELDGRQSITRDMAENLYVGMMTDTGNFSFSNLTPELFETVADIVRKGVNIPQIHSRVYNSYTIDRLRLLGHTIGKMETMTVGDVEVAYMTLNEAELRSYNFQPGDTEGFVNFPLTIGKVAISAMFIQTRNFVRVSLRSRGDIDVSDFARRYFEGGGHKNAAGGKFFKRIPATVAHFRQSVLDFFGVEACSCGCHENGEKCTNK